MKNIFLLSFLFLSGSLAGHTIMVRLFSNYEITQIQASFHGNAYAVLALNGKGDVTDTVAYLNKNGSTKQVHIQTLAGGFVLKVGGVNKGTFGHLKIAPLADTAHFIIKGKGRERIYSGILTIKKRGANLLVINTIELEEYVAGVVESEGGHVDSYEYFRAQAVLARTWVLRNWNKHLDEGYNVKDDQSSQAYYSKAYLQNSREIIRAVQATADSVLIFGQKELVFGAYHANSGGETVNADDYWNESIPYLRGVVDTFSLAMEKAYWEKELDKEKFIAFFASELGFSASNSDFRKAVVGITQTHREPYFYYQGKKMKMRAVREKFQLRSTFFSVTDKGSTVLLKGRGFGHGIGLSQEGAMRMAQLGYNYKQILTHYFPGTRLASANVVLPKS